MDIKVGDKKISCKKMGSGVNREWTPIAGPAKAGSSPVIRWCLRFKNKEAGVNGACRPVGTTTRGTSNVAKRVRADELSRWMTPEEIVAAWGGRVPRAALAERAVGAALPAQ